MPKEKHILFLVPDGVGIKNYIYSNIIKELKENAKISIWSPLPIEAFADVKKIHNIDFQYKQIKLKPENIKTRLYREATTFARLIHNSKIQSNPSILTNWRPSKYSLKVKLLYKSAEILGSYLSKKYTKILHFEQKSRNNISSLTIDNYIKELEKLNPTSILITHQRVPGLMPICLAARKLNIKTFTAIFSWDNLPKAKLVVNSDYYIVWSEWMKAEMKTYYPEISENRVLLIGSPQFEFYLDKNRITPREEFAHIHGLDIHKKWICFSGDDQITSPFDNLFLDDIATSLESEKDDIQIIFRRCPVDFSTRYDSTLSKFNNLIVSIDPLWNNESNSGWVGYFPKYQDIDMQVNLAYHCSMVINLGSTMALDFSIYDKPCLYLNYNPAYSKVWSTEMIYSFQHFRSMNGLDAVGWLNDKDSIRNTVLKALNPKQEIAVDRKKWMEKLVLHPLDENSSKIAKALL
ncbi:hypothetical protein [Winogradskyella endarachnes]|uniref:UDP-glycosyltransferase n=1 Tax=Winogradskyella endarachnes TaxID=2681965 RepID=A0A6L6U7T7_9FLAO|nr:hypothetical protein [Winogradskyella endarachnes]MUU77646.1 hypothetical protein [Winogradskyella endarachnes]